MEIRPNGKFQWNGVFIDEGGEASEFVTFADTMADAIRLSVDIPGEIVVLARGDDVSGVSFELPEGVAAKISGAMKRAVN